MDEEEVGTLVDEGESFEEGVRGFLKLFELVVMVIAVSFISWCR